MPFGLALAQVAPEKGKVDANLARMAEAARQALREGAELVAFPESVVTGYFLEGAVDQHALSARSLLERFSRELGPPGRQLDVLVGFYEAAEGQPHNSAAYLSLGPQGDRVVHVHRKVFLPTYGLFDEQRFHQPGREFRAFETRLGRFGTLVCEDAWHSISGTLLALDGAMLVLVPSASPVRDLSDPRPGNVRRYERLLRSMSEEHGVFSAATLLTGSEGGKLFSGGSMVFDPFGDLMAEAPLDEDALVLAEVDLAVANLARQKTPLLDDLKAFWPASFKL